MELNINHENQKWVWMYLSMWRLILHMHISKKTLDLHQVNLCPAGQPRSDRMEAMEKGHKM